MTYSVTALHAILSEQIQGTQQCDHKAYVVHRVGGHSESLLRD